MDAPLSAPRGGGAGGGGTGDQQEVDFILLIPDEFIGAVLGKGGATIKRLQWQTHTTIRCSPPNAVHPGTSSRLVTLSSASAAALDAAQSLILLTVAQEHSTAFCEVSALLARIRPTKPRAGRAVPGEGSLILLDLRWGCSWMRE